MSTAIAVDDVRAIRVHVTDAEVVVELEDGRTLSVPISWYPRLAYATPQERSDFRIVADGVGIHWPQLDEDISIGGMLAGHRSGESPESLARWKQQLEERRKQPHPSPWGEVLPLPDWWEGR